MGNRGEYEMTVRNTCRKKNRRTDCGVLPIFFVEPWGLWCLLDTGSDGTIVSTKGVRKLGETSNIRKCGCKVVTVAGVKPLLGEVEIDCAKLVGDDFKIVTHVAEIPSEKYDIIIGCDLMERVESYTETRNGRWKIKLGMKSYRAGRAIGRKKHVTVGSMECMKEPSRAMVMGIMDKFRNAFYKEGELLTTTGMVRHSIELDNDRPVYIKPRRYPHAMRDIIRTHIDEMLSQGIIRKSMSPYCSPLWVVPKATKDGENQKYRVVVDYRELNRRTKLEKYPLPRLEDMLDRMAGSSIFSTFDLKAGYHQIQMDPRDVEKTAFIFERGHYEFLRMPFGLKNAPATFQRLMDEFLEGLDERVIQVYMDDIIVFSRNLAEHRVHLECLLKRIEEFGLKISVEKSNLCQPEVKFMGHIVSAEGARPNEEKVRAIKEMPVPRNVKEVRTFLGMMGYYRKFVANLAKKTEPLTALLRKGVKFNVSPEVIESVNRCKEELCSAPVLGFPDFNKPFLLTTDASQEAVGAVLSQPSQDGDRPIAYGSRKLTQAERRYSTIERELLGVVWGVEHFRPYLFGRLFTIKTDHMPLIWVQKLKETSARITKWKEKLAAYSFTIVHTKGTDNVVADCLSRNINCMNGTGTETAGAIEGTSEGGAERERRVMQFLNQMINDKRNQLILERTDDPNPESACHRYGHLLVTTLKIGEGTSDENWIKILNQTVKGGKTYNVYSRSRTLRRKLKELYESGRIGRESTLVGCEKRVDTVENEEEQNRIVLSYHIGKTNHRGVQETVDHLRRSYYWIDMPRTVKQIISSCTVCNLSKYDRTPHETPQMITPTPTEPMKIIQMDTFHYQGEKYITTIDTFTRLAYAHQLQDKSARSVVEGLLTFLGTFGCPQEIVADRGREFQNRRVKDMVREFNIQLRFTTVGHPRSHGLIERLHSTLTEHLHLLKVARNITGKEAMARAVLAYNSSIHSATGYTPLELMFHRGGETIGKSIRAIWEDVTNRELRTKTRGTLDVNQKRGEDIGRLVRIGDIVYKKNFYKRKETDVRFLGPYEVVKRLNRNRILVKKVGHPGVRREVVHLNEIKLPSRGGRSHVKIKKNKV